MGYFDFVTPDLAQDDEQDVGPQLPADEQRRQVASKESDAAKIEQGAVKTAHDVLKVATVPGSPGSFNSQLLQVKDALDKGRLKPHQLASDLEVILKKPNPEHLRQDQIQALSGALNDLKVSQQRRADVDAWSKLIPGEAPQIPAANLSQSAQDAMEKAKRLREEASNMGVLGQGPKIQAAKNLESQAAGLTKMAAEQGGATSVAQEGNTGTNVTPEGSEPQYFDPDTGHPVDGQPPRPDLNSSIDSNIKAAGRDPQQFRQALVAGAKTLEEKMGVDTKSLKDPVPFSRALLTGLQIFDPQGIILGQLQQDLQPNAGGGGQQQKTATSGQGASATQTTPDEDLHTQNLKQMRDQRRQLYQQLAQTPELNNWFGVLTFIFLSVITRSPAAAASILGISQRQGNLKSQLDLIEKEMHDEAFNLKQAQHEGDLARKMAAERALHQSDKADEYRKELMKMYLNHHAILLREAARHPEGGEAYKRLDKDFARYASMESASHSEMQRADKDRNDPYADDAHKAQAEKDYIKAQKDYNFWKTKRANLNSMLEQMNPANGSEEAGQ